MVDDGFECRDLNWIELRLWSSVAEGGFRTMAVLSVIVAIVVITVLNIALVVHCNSAALQYFDGEERGWP